MANVLFKRGTQASLETIRTTGGVDGTFYLTNDTHRLYVGLADKSIVPVNEGVITVASVSVLPITGHAGEFYYATQENVLCVYNGTKWVQINPDTDTKIEGFEYSVSTSSGTATITTTISSDDSSSKADSFTIKGAGGATVTSSGKNITVTSDTYSLSDTVTDNKATVKLTSSAGDSASSSINLKAGDHVVITKDGNDIKISSEVSAIESVAVANQTGGGFTVSVKDDLSGAAKSGSFDPVVKVGSDTTVTDNQVHFTNGIATLPVYSKDDIDKKLIGLNAMTFRGVVNDYESINKSTVHNGDTYKVGNEFTAGTVAYHVGDLLIAQGTENTNGYIPAASITWERVSSGDGAVVTYAGEGITHGLQLKESDSTVVGSIALATEVNSALSLTDSGSGSSKIVTVNHNKVTKADSTEAEVTQSTDTAVEINPVVGVTFDNYGHVSGVKTKKFTLTDTHNDITSVTMGVTAANNVGSITTTVATDDGTSKNDTFTLGSSTLSITASGKALTADMVWGDF